MTQYKYDKGDELYYNGDKVEVVSLGMPKKIIPHYLVRFTDLERSGEFISERFLSKTPDG